MRLKKEMVACFVFGAAITFTVMLSSANKYLANVFSTPLVGEDRSNTAETETNKHLNIFNATNESKEVRDSVSKHKCIPYKTKGGGAFVCVHPRETDIYVSGDFLRSGQYQAGLVGQAVKALTTHRGMSFLDLGCNIGTFTIYLAKMGIRVVGVDASKENLLLLSRALKLGKLQQNVTLILNALSDTHRYVTLREVATNKGARFVIPSEDQDKGAVQTIMLDELAFMFTGQSLFIKMDIEGSELKALNGGKHFFKTVDVRYVLMEFVFHLKNQSGKHICNFFTENGFRPYRGISEDSSVWNIALNTTKYQSWPENVLWIKE